MRRTSFNSTGFIRLLSELTVVEVADSRQSFAERLGQWLNWTDAISLSVALDGNAARAPDAQPSSATPEQCEHDCERVRKALSKTMAEEGPDSADTDYSTHRRHYVAQQRLMETRIGSLRASLRNALAARSAAASRLAALDAVLDEVLIARERSVLSTVPSLLERHFERLRKADSADWLAIYGKDMRGVLLAELEIRMQPVEGLIEALRGATGNEAGKPQ